MFCRSLLEGLLAAWREASPWQTPCVLDYFFFASVKPPDIYTSTDITGFIRMNLPCPTDQFLFFFFNFRMVWINSFRIHNQVNYMELQWHSPHFQLVLCSCICWAFFVFMTCACIHSTGPSARPDDVCSPSEWRLCGEDVGVSTVSPHDLTDHFIDSARKVWRKPGG